MAEETYLGDGLYARYNGQEIWLRAPREGGDHEVCLDTDMLEQLQKLVPGVIGIVDVHRSCSGRR